MIEQIKGNQQVHNEIAILLNEFSLDASLKNRIAAAYFDIAMEHHQSIILLINHQLYGTAFAIVRPLYETYMRFLYLLTLEKQVDIEKISKGKYEFPGMEKIVQHIDKSFATDTFFSDLRKDGWKHMNDYIHSGSLQLGRRFTENKVLPNYTDDEITEVLKSSSAIIILFAIGFFKFFGDFEKAQKAENLLQIQTNENNRRKE